jgi:hypothetical protein
MTGDDTGCMSGDAETGSTGAVNGWDRSGERAKIVCMMNKSRAG